MTYLDPRMQGLVKAMQKIAEFSAYENRHPEISRVAHEALSEASKPLKEFAGMSAYNWRDLSKSIEYFGFHLTIEGKRITDACRQIAESLEP